MIEGGIIMSTDMESRRGPEWDVCVNLSGGVSGSRGDEDCKFKKSGEEVL